MKDRDSRRRLAAVIRGYVTGRETNWQFDDVGCELRDHTAAAIWDLLYLTYDDHPEQLIPAVKREDSDLRDWYLRSILFLESDFEYEWPAYHLNRRWFSWLWNLCSFGRSRRKELADEEARIMEWRQAGDIEVWPFFRRGDYCSVLANPIRMTGKSLFEEISDDSAEFESTRVSLTDAATMNGSAP